jgi:hypothetical protein
LRLGSSWPRTAGSLVDYLHECMGEGCSKSFPETLRASVVWIEARSGLPAEDRFGKDEFFLRNVERAQVVLGSGAALVTKAPRFPMIVVAAMEAFLVDDTQPLGLRLMAFARLVKVFAVLRWDDVQRIRPRDFMLRSAGLTGRLTQTKTSGAGKKARELPLFIPAGAFIVRRDWQEVGYGLWSQLDNDDRDFFLPRVKADLVTHGKSPASGRDLSILGALLLTYLTVPEYLTTGEKFELGDLVEENSEPGTIAESRWITGKVKLLPPNLVPGWTGHSERATLPSLFAAMGVSKAERDPLGRWSATGSDEYVRTYKALMRNLTGKLRGAVCSGMLSEVGDEEDAMEDVVGFLSIKGPVSDITKELAKSFAKMLGQFYKAVAMTSAAQMVEAPQELHVAELQVSPDEEEARIKVALYIIATSRRGATICLHKGGGCWRAQGMHFKNYELWHEEVPEALYSSYCHDCWPREGPAIVAVCKAISSASSDASSAEQSE